MPDGRRLDYAGVTRAGTDLLTVGADGRRRRRLTATRGPDETYPAWSPDGRRALLVQRFDDDALTDEIGAVPATLGRATMLASLVNDVEASEGASHLSWQPRPPRRTRGAPLQGPSPPPDGP